MTRFQLLSLLLCGCLLLTSTLRPVHGDEDEYEDIEDEGSEEEKSEGEAEEADVVVLTKDNFQEKIDSAKYALVRHPPSTFRRLMSSLLRSNSTLLGVVTAKYVFLFRSSTYHYLFSRH